MRGVRRAGGIAFLAQGGGLGLAFGAQVILARALPDREYGTFRYYWSWVTLLSIVACLGFRSVFQRFLPCYLDEERRGLVRGLVAGGLRVTSFAALVLGGVLLVAVRLAPAVRDGAIPYGPAIVAVGVLVMYVRLNMLAHLNRALGAFASGLLPLYWGRPIAVGLSGVVVTYWMVPKSSHALAALVVLLGVLVVTVELSTRRRLAPIVGAEAPIYAWREWMEVGVPLLLISGFEVALTQTDILVLGSLAGAEAAGGYGVSALVANTSALFMAAGVLVLAPAVAPLLQKGETAAAERLTRRIAAWVAGGTSVYSAGLMIAMPLILRIFGAHYVDPELVAAGRILIGGYVVAGLLGPGMVLLNMGGKQATSALVYGLAALANLGLNILLIPKWGVLGAAVASAGSTIAWTAVMAAVAFSGLGINPTCVPWMAARRQGE